MVKYSSSLDATFAALSDPTRRSILHRLQRGQASVSEIAEPFPMSMPAILKHLHVLEQAGLIEQKKSGRIRMCRLTPQPMLQAVDWLTLYRSFWETQLDSLGHFLNQPDPKSNQETEPCRNPSPRQPKRS